MRKGGGEVRLGCVDWVRVGGGAMWWVRGRGWRGMCMGLCEIWVLV